VILSILSAILKRETPAVFHNHGRILYISEIARTVNDRDHYYLSVATPEHSPGSAATATTGGTTLPVFRHSSCDTIDT
jgi:hypothetical protein